ncbi:hypothetical protein FA95DRAFT_1559697 [Auriscalpium vulgare]|uniref:Uncharacterized protein n=1 Tax=Auriscalpium vulgare TaxID=40419 RepID=A0ACB8RTJ3_9AGAM|nr:hypothetical protein FA95DRAFT_1559697 [Auriscalpium vulgare]
MAPSTRKRPRPSSPGPVDADVTLTNEPSKFNRHPDLWYDDGNVIIATKTQACKVYRGLLSRESPVLNSLFETDVDEKRRTYEGTPVYEVTDSDDDIAAVLKYVCGMERNHKDVATLTFEATLAYFRLGTKYEITRLREEAISRLEMCYPSTLDSFDCPRNPRPITHTIGQDSEVSLLALQNYATLHQLLPAALYACCTLTTTKLISGIEFAFDFMEPPPASKLADFWAKVYNGRARLEESRVDDTLCFLDGAVSNNCERPACEKTIQSSFRQDRALSRPNPNALENVGPTIKKNSGAKPCKSCVTYWISRHVEGRQRVWDKLRDIFDIPEPAAGGDVAPADVS